MPCIGLEVLRRNADGTVDVQMITDRGQTEVPGPYRHTIEPEYLYPLLRGRDVKKWAAEIDSTRCFLMMQDPSTRSGFKEAALRGMPRLRTYLSKYEAHLRNRAAFKRYFDKSDAYYSMFNVGDYTFAPYKIVWPEQASGFSVWSIEATGGRAVIPDHKLMMVGFDNRVEAHFVAAVLNSTPYRFACQTYAIDIQHDTHFLSNVHAPTFDGKDRVHLDLAALSVEAHAVSRGEAGRSIGLIEADIDEVARALWHLSPEDLESISTELRDMEQ